MTRPEDILPIAREAAAAIMKIYLAPETWGTEHKEDASPLTEADKAAHRVIAAGLAALPEQLPVLSEEGGALTYAERSGWTRYWLVDPLDGTKEFLRRNGQFTVNIALIDNHRPVMGVVLAPVTGDLYYAANGQGAWLEREGVRQQISAKRFDMRSPGLRVLASGSHLNEETQAFISKLNQPVITPKGSSLKLLMIAEGKADIYPRLGPTSEWDIAAAQAVLEEAGGKVLAWDTVKPLVYNKENLLNPWFVAYGMLD